MNPSFSSAFFLASVISVLCLFMVISGVVRLIVAVSVIRRGVLSVGFPSSSGGWSLPADSILTNKE